jgi:hypothetical protein
VEPVTDTVPPTLTYLKDAIFHAHRLAAAAHKSAASLPAITLIPIGDVSRELAARELKALARTKLKSAAASPKRSARGIVFKNRIHDRVVE